VNDAPEPVPGRLSALEHEHLLRLRAEWELAELRARVAKTALEEAARHAAQARGLAEGCEIDWDRGLVRPISSKQRE
jgi:hypothetical protein